MIKWESYATYRVAVVYATYMVAVVCAINNTVAQARVTRGERGTGLCIPWQFRFKSCHYI